MIVTFPSAIVRLAVAAALAFALTPAFAAPAPSGTADIAKVLQPGPLPELELGDPKGVAVVEYGSLTCPHCAAWGNGRSSPA